MLTDLHYRTRFDLRRNIRTGIFVLALGSLSACVLDSELEDDFLDTTSQSVVGGTFESNARHPWVVKFAGCHGTLVGPQWVLTAAHCVSANQFGLDVFAPANQDDQQHRVARVFDIHVHPDYVPGNSRFAPVHDVALVKLEHPFQINKDVQTAALADHSLSVGQRGRIASTRDHGGGGVTPTGQLSVYEAAVANCRYANDVFCTAATATTICSGDSGSGFVEIANADDGQKRATVFGVASFGAASCDPGELSGFADVRINKDWMLTTMGVTETSLRGNVRMAWNGLASEGTIRLDCYDYLQRPVWAEAPMNLEGVEIGLSCGASSEIQATCDLRGLRPDREIGGFKRDHTEFLHARDFASSFEFIPGAASPQTYVCRVDLPVALYVPLL